MDGSWTLHGLLAWVFKHGSTPAGLCGWSYHLWAACRSDTMARQSLCPAFHKRTCNSKVVNKILNPYEFMTKVQVLNTLGSILGRKWQFDAFQKAKLKFLKLVTESQILEVFFLYHSCFVLGESCPIPILDMESIFLNPFKTDHLALTFPLKYNIKILCS